MIHALLDSKRVTGAYRFVLTPGQRDDDAGDGAGCSCARTIAKLGLAPLTSMFAFGENQPGAGRLPPRGPRLRRPVDPGRRRRVDLAAAGQPEAPAGHLVHPDQPARLRPDAARPLARPATRIWRRCTSAGPSAWVEPVGSWGTGPRRAGADPDARRDQRQHRRLLGAADARRCPASRSTSPTGSAGRATANAARRQGLGGADAARPRLRQAARRRHQFRRRLRRAAAARRWRRTTTIEPVIWVDANAEVRERNLFRNRSAAPGA